jgi:hypothetical protein
MGYGGLEDSRMSGTRISGRPFSTKYAVTHKFFWNARKKPFIVVLPLFVLISLFPSGLFAEDYPIIEFKTLPAEIRTNISAFPVTGRVPPDTNAVYVDSNEVYFDPNGLDVFAVVDLNYGNNKLILKFVDQNDGVIKEYEKNILFDPNYPTAENELVYANCVYRAGEGTYKLGGVLVIDVRENTFLGIIKNHRIRGIRKNGSEIILTNGERYSTESHSYTGETLPELGLGYLKLVFSNDGKFVYYRSCRTHLASNLKDANLPVDIGSRADITSDDQRIFVPNGYIDLKSNTFTQKNYSKGSRAIRAGFAVESKGKYVLHSSFSYMSGKLVILSAEEPDDPNYYYYWGGDYAGDIVFSPDGKQAYTGFYGNTWSSGGRILIIDMNTFQCDNCNEICRFELHGPSSLTVSKDGKIYASVFYTLNAGHFVGDPNKRGIVELLPTGMSFRVSKLFFVSLLSRMDEPYYGGNKIFYKSGAEKKRQIIHVDADAPGSIHDGSSWDKAYKYLQDALAAAARGDEIRVAQGTYKPDANAVNPGGTGDREATFQLIYGGDINTPDVKDDNSYHVVTGGGTNAMAILDGFTITAGNASGTWPDPNTLGGGMYNLFGSPTLMNCTFSGNSAKYFGGGMYNLCGRPRLNNCSFSSNFADRGGGGMYNKYSHPALTNCTFNGNWAAAWRGGGMDNWYSHPTLTSCTFSRNSAKIGGGMCNEIDGNPTLTNCKFTNNSAEDQGGGMGNGGSSPTLINCIFSGNSADGGGGMYNFGYSSPKLTNCTFSGNSALLRHGGGICNWAGSQTTLVNCTFAGNSASDGNAISCDSYEQRLSEVSVANCILWDGGNEIWNNDGSTIMVSYSDVNGGQMGVYDPCGGLVWGPGNIEADPRFADPNNEDYHLKSLGGRWDPNSQTWVQDNVTSLCIDAGNPGCPLADEPNDLNNIRINMGAYGGTAEASKSPANWALLADLTNEGKVNSSDLGAFVDNWLDSGACIPSDLNRDEFVDMIDFALFAQGWLLETSWYAP